MSKQLWLKLKIAILSTLTLLFASACGRYHLPPDINLPILHVKNPVSYVGGSDNIPFKRGKPSIPAGMHPLILTKEVTPKHPWFTIKDLKIRSWSIVALTDDSRWAGYDVAANIKYPVLWQSGSITLLKGPAKWDGTNVLALNNRGQAIIGTDRQAAVWDHGKLQPLHDLHDLNIWNIRRHSLTWQDTVRGFAINDKGEIVSEGLSSSTRIEHHSSDPYFTPRSKIQKWTTTVRAYHPFLLRKGRYIDLGAIPNVGDDSVAYAMNNKSQVAGVSGFSHASLWQNGHMQDLGMLPGYEYAAALAINGRSQIVGICSAGTEINDGPGVELTPDYYDEPFLWENGKMRDLGSLAGYPKTIVRGINNASDVIGYVDNTYTRMKTLNIPLLWRKGKLYDINNLIQIHKGLILTESCAINNKGQIVCFGYDRSVTSDTNSWPTPNVFLLTPKP